MIIVTNSDILGSNICFLRKSLGMTRQELAEHIGWDKFLLAELEEDIVREIDSRILIRICDFFHRDMDDMLTNDYK